PEAALWSSKELLTANSRKVLRRNGAGRAGPGQRLVGGGGGRSEHERSRGRSGKVSGTGSIRGDRDYAGENVEAGDVLGGVVAAAGRRDVGRQHSLRLVVLGDRGLARVGGDDQFRHLRANGVVLVGWNGDGRQDRDDRDHDHQFDQGEAFLHGLHGGSSVG